MATTANRIGMQFFVALVICEKTPTMDRFK